MLLLSLSPWIDHLWQKSASPYFLYMPSEVRICASNQDSLPVSPQTFNEDLITLYLPIFEELSSLDL